MGSFECNSIDDLVFNRSFREWVASPQSSQNAFWTNWIAENPQKAEIVNQSKAIIYTLHINLKGLSDDAINYEIGKILQKLKEDTPASDTEFAEERNNKSGILTNRYFQLSSIAAVLLIVFGLVFLDRKKTSTVATTKTTYESLLSERKKDPIDQVNNTAVAQIINLPDGSRVYLEAKSKLSYARDFSGSKREVYLVGEAFFEVKKDPSRPFLVYTSTLITKVLGTSFRVRAYASDKRAIITVRTGKVSVFKTENFSEEMLKTNKLSGIVLTPNQQVVYTSENNELNKRITEKPEIITNPAKRAFVFDATPMQQVFRTMQDVYNVPIVYDEEVMSGCSLSASMGDEPFYEKLNLICKAINASYEMIDGQIVIVSKGCK